VSNKQIFYFVLGYTTSTLLAAECWHTKLRGSVDHKDDNLWAIEYCVDFCRMWL